MTNDDLPRVAPSAVAPDHGDLPRSPQPDSSRQCETRDVFGGVLCCHGRPMACLECGEEYAAELNGPAGGAREDAPEKSEQSTGASLRDAFAAGMSYGVQYSGWTSDQAWADYTARRTPGAVSKSIAVDPHVEVPGTRAPREKNSSSSLDVLPLERGA